MRLVNYALALITESSSYTHWVYSRCKKVYSGYCFSGFLKVQEECIFMKYNGKLYE